MPRQIGKAAMLSAIEFTTAHSKANEILDYLRTLERTPEVDRLIFLAVQLTSALQTDQEKEQAMEKMNLVYSRERARMEAGYFDANGNLTEIGERDPLGHFTPTGQLIEPEGPPKYVGAVLTGRGRNGAQRDAGLVVHLIENPNRRWPIFGKSLCGRKPGKTSNGWDADGNKQATCKACLKKAEVPMEEPAPPVCQTCLGAEDQTPPSYIRSAHLNCPDCGRRFKVKGT